MESVVLTMILVVAVIALLVWWVVGSTLRRCEILKQAMHMIPGFNPTQMINDGRVGIAVDEHAKRVAFAEQVPGGAAPWTRTYSYGDLVKCELIEDKVPHTEKLAFGLTNTTSKVTRLALRVVTSDMSRPAHVIEFSPDLRDGRSGAEHWHGLVCAMMSEAGSYARTDLAAEISRLNELSDDGVISAEEFERAKQLYLGKPADRREEALRSLRSLHELYTGKVLSESEFNQKKWEILSRKDL